MKKQISDTPMDLSHDIFPRIQPHFYSWIKLYVCTKFIRAKDEIEAEKVEKLLNESIMEIVEKRQDEAIQSDNNYSRRIAKKVKLGTYEFPANVDLIIPPLALHRNPDIWGKDVHLFKPERFSEGLAKATNGTESRGPIVRRPRTRSSTTPFNTSSIPAHSDVLATGSTSAAQSNEANIATLTGPVQKLEASICPSTLFDDEGKEYDIMSSYDILSSFIMS
ncbi:hypothetical protein BUALT_Bualt05G0139900 [Buddleja alternifolia]|uniref:Uncharacterized protein n=1 Tax=Buddleja alternifolia TaxID=168488 RepID=A0AAV6XNF4_9LAMI|nr:hypothetical protein BUALT_Bualt05G0139900 [Buddleja alternifolia]